MNTLTPFQFEAHAVRVQMDTVGQPWFNANDVCGVLEMGNARQALDSHVDAEDVTKLDTLTAGGRQRQNHINESGLYALILGSTKDSAKRFKRWVTAEVLPAIRQTGHYHAQPATHQPTVSERGLALAQQYRSLADSLAIPVSALHGAAIAHITRETGIEFDLSVVKAPAQPASRVDQARLAALWVDIHALLAKQPDINLHPSKNRLSLVPITLLYALNGRWRMPEIHRLLRNSTAPHPVFIGKKTQEHPWRGKVTAWMFEGDRK